MEILKIEVITVNNGGQVGELPETELACQVVNATMEAHSSDSICHLYYIVSLDVTNQLFHITEKDISTFVDLASGTLSEDDEAAQKTRYLINALTGYSPLIYDFDDTKETDFTQFMGYCNEVWKAYGENNRLERNLVTVELKFSQCVCVYKTLCTGHNCLLIVLINVISVNFKNCLSCERHSL